MQSKTLFGSHERILWIMVFAFSALRLISAPAFGYGVDEAHYLLYARHLDWSYFDHPPLVGWVHYLFSFFGENELIARIPAILLGALDTVLIYGLLKQYDRTAALWAAAALNGSFVLDVLFLTLMPDSLLLTAMLLAVYALRRLLADPSVTSYLLMGIAFGLAGLSKYTAVLLIPAAIAYVLWVRRPQLLFTPKLAMTFLSALVIISPVIVWNLHNGMASFAYQSSHVVGAENGNWKNFFLSLGRQAGAYNPLLFIVAFYGLYHALKERSFRLETAFGIAILGFMFVSQYRHVALPHWISPFFLLFIPIGIVYLYRRSPKTAKTVVIISLSLSTIIHAELIAKLGKFSDYRSAFRDILGWNRVAEHAAQHLRALQTQNGALAVTNWSLASRIMVYTDAPVFLIDERQDQFDLWQKDSPLGKDLLFINPRSFHKAIAQTYQCSSVQTLSSENVVLNGAIVDTFSYELCRNYGGMK
ncbi:MAG: ArnT family glycosyltransferase [Sulfuricurvum sp.]